MASVTLTTFLTTDGVMQAPGGPEEDTSGGFRHGGWLVPYADQDMMTFVDETFSRASGFLLGRRTYEIFAAYWPDVSDEEDPDVAARLNRLPKYVASTTLGTPGWNNSQVLSGDVPDQVAKLKESTDGDLQIHGSGVLARSLLAHGLVDEMRLLVYPVVLGSGKRLFTEGAQPTALELTDRRTTGTGVTIQTYRNVGQPRYGSFLPDSA